MSPIRRRRYGKWQSGNISLVMQLSHLGNTCASPQNCVHNPLTDEKKQR
jgi:hypothetical protein